MSIRKREMSNLKILLEKIDKEVNKEKKAAKDPAEMMKQLKENFPELFKFLVKRKDVQIKNIIVKSENPGIVVGGLEGAPKRVELRDKMLDDLKKQMSPFKPRSSMGGAGRGTEETSTTPSIRFKNKWALAFSPTVGERGVGGGAAVDFEEAIANAWNGVTPISRSERVSEVSEKVVEKLRAMRALKSIKAEAVWTGSDRMSDVSDFWKEHVARPDRTPKTDLFITNNHRISIKVGRKAQITSSNIIKGEGSAILLYAADEAKIGNATINRLRRWFNVDKEEFNRKKFEDDLNEIMDDNEEFKRFFVRECLTGEQKFDGVIGAERGIANYILALIPGDDPKVKFESLSESNKEYLQKLASQVKVFSSLKSSRGISRPTIRAEIKEETILPVSLNDMIQFAESLGIPTFDLLDESIRDTFTKIKEALKRIMEKGFSKLLELFNIKIDVKVKGIEDVDFFS